MFFYLSKIVWFFLQPSAFCAFLIIAGVILTKTRWEKTGKLAVKVGAIGVLLVAFSPFGRQLMIPLEDRFSLITFEEQKKKKVDGIVVLGGTVHMYVSDQRGVPSIVSGAERIIEAVKLATHFKEAKIVLSGGPNTFVKNPTPDAVIVKQLMVDMGIDAKRILVEGKSRNTWENAVFAKKLAQPKKGENWLLVTSAYHMPRAMGTFRQAEFEVAAYPVDYYTGGETSRFSPFYYAMDGVTITDTAAKEWLGLIVYKLTGRSSGFFPKPQL
ncbi:MAG: YdcF family protein [Hyphomicrobiales bacterium]